jgi:hypothetical protein
MRGVAEGTRQLFSYVDIEEGPHHGQQLIHISDDRLQSRQNTKAIGKYRLASVLPATQRAIICKPAGPRCQIHYAANAKT